MSQYNDEANKTEAAKRAAADAAAKAKAQADAAKAAASDKTEQAKAAAEQARRTAQEKAEQFKAQTAGAQDKASIPLQLAAIARGDPKQLTGAIDIFVGEDRDAAIYRFTVVGQEQIDTKLGILQTWHLTRPPQPGSYKSQLDIWLAPAHGWYPVRIRNTERNGAVTTQTVNNIVLDHSGS